jgi:hypothetical protein
LASETGSRLSKASEFSLSSIGAASAASVTAPWLLCRLGAGFGGRCHVLAQNRDRQEAESHSRDRTLGFLDTREHDRNRREKRKKKELTPEEKQKD